MPADAPRLKKELTLFDVYAISTGAMFSSGFFLLPGLATAQAGPATVLAYFLAGVFILPALFSAAELSTAMPKAGGAYYFLDRSLGPLAGTVGGIGTWLALVLKSAFALVGMGAYLVFFIDIPVKPLAVALTVAFAVLNVVGAKETSGLQRVLVTVLVGVLAFFVVQGLVEVGRLGGDNLAQQFTPFSPFGVEGLLATVGLVFVSYAGLTKVASVAEEVQNPDRNLPLGMFLSLATATAIYCVGVFIMIAVLDPSELRSDLTPVATAAEKFFTWLPEPWGLGLIVAAAIAAFASTGNAGILSASRYPLAMARDGLVTQKLGVLGRFGTPTTAVVVTSALMVFVIVALDVEGIAKLASAFQLLLFGLLNVAVIVMRESRIPSYVPGYRSPLYPWVQIVGILLPIVLIAQLGGFAIFLSMVMIAGGVAWYVWYVKDNPRVEREGAIYHLFERLGRSRYEGLDSELRTILKDKGLPDETPFEHLVTRSTVLDVDADASFESVARRAAASLAARAGLPAARLETAFLDGSRTGATPVSRGVALPHLRLPEVDRPELVIVRSQSGLSIGVDTVGDERPDTDHTVYAVFFLLSPKEPPGRHLRTLASIASRIDEAPFMDDWRAADTEQDLKEVLLHNDRLLALALTGDGPTADLVGRALKDVPLPRGVLVALVHRDGAVAVPSGATVLRRGDRLTILGDPAGIAALEARMRG
ncbi:amino acid transporter [Rubrivirga sp. SAORIC476]|uniref:amino acid permease n=1 Tax=Rubrivirga sp. SAORIC476 TaxID=1961794 RepID=UPI000BA90F8B|nr:amino acid permease [Rubrivirga sp. SAORIC476]MAQ92884.1 amino acid transporter [Rhodothermaceae bacterium]MBC14342.1 amino acid transporter [Rhodothermaceae bacterium]PAP79599.1 amino acid transporter [Rubrivirga sp. SAORIC476]